MARAPGMTAPPERPEDVYLCPATGDGQRAKGDGEMLARRAGGIVARRSRRPRRPARPAAGKSCGLSQGRGVLLCSVVAHVTGRVQGCHPPPTAACCRRRLVSLTRPRGHGDPPGAGQSPQYLGSGGGPAPRAAASPALTARASPAATPPPKAASVAPLTLAIYLPASCDVAGVRAGPVNNGRMSCLTSPRNIPLLGPHVVLLFSHYTTRAAFAASFAPFVSLEPCRPPISRSSQILDWALRLFKLSRY
ncbi:hypothetical protein CC78DRAFT_580572 [Lojkania enalia]|uniref:Uncharacterized protein n=1 Tax=Lojkania enalia TaxID=147567 RepID=A0A9P4MZY3_9PLEO|nr:hypothetical protein CC78DRAFT_580572 [Didymosphaeria enalia]